MNLPSTTKHKARALPSSTQESAAVKWLLIALAGAFAAVFLLLPLINVFAQAFSYGCRRLTGRP